MKHILVYKSKLKIIVLLLFSMSSTLLHSQNDGLLKPFVRNYVLTTTPFLTLDRQSDLDSFPLLEGPYRVDLNDPVSLLAACLNTDVDFVETFRKEAQSWPPVTNFEHPLELNDGVPFWLYYDYTLKVRTPLLTLNVYKLDFRLEGYQCKSIVVVLSQIGEKWNLVDLGIGRNYAAFGLPLFVDYEHFTELYSKRENYLSPEIHDDVWYNDLLLIDQLKSKYLLADGKKNRCDE